MEYRLLRAALVLWFLLVAVAACDAANPTPAPFVVAPHATVEDGLGVATDAPAAATSTPAPAILPVTKAVDGRFLFVEIWYDASGTGNLPRKTIEFPTYAFDSAKGIFSPTEFSRGRPIALHTGDWGLVGTGSSRMGSAGSGSGNGLERLITLPFSTTVVLPTGQATDNGETTRKAVVNLQGATSDGKLEAVIDGERVVLAPGARWQRKLTPALTTAAHSGQYDLTSTVTNYGWLEQSKLPVSP